jgi:hypothetical protein
VSLADLSAPADLPTATLQLESRPDKPDRHGRCSGPGRCALSLRSAAGATWRPASWRRLARRDWLPQVFSGELADKSGADNEQFLRGFSWDGKELKPTFEVDFTKEQLGRKMGLSVAHFILGSFLNELGYIHDAP